MKRGRELAEFVAKDKEFLFMLGTIKHNTALLADGKGASYHQSMNLLVYLNNNGLYPDDNRPSILAINLCKHILEKNHRADLGVVDWPPSLQNFYEKLTEKVYLETL